MNQSPSIMISLESLPIDDLSTAMLQIRLFGPLRLIYHEQPLKFAALPKTLPLWAYLLLQRHKPLPRPHLAYTFWPDASEAEARSNLRRHLYELRRVLPPAPDDRPWLLAETNTVQWNPQADCWLDVAVFEEASLTPQTTPANLAIAVELYTNDLLPELYDDWIFGVRERLRNLFFDNLDKLITHHNARQEYIEAIGYAQTARQHDPLREDVVRDLMRLRQASGDRAGALLEYRRFKQRLRAELDVAPMIETSALYDAIAGQLAPPGSSIPANGASPPGNRTSSLTAPPTTPLLPSPPISPRSSPPTSTPANNLPAQLTSFVGRAATLAAVCAVLCSQQEPVRLLTLTGPGGSGKTRLALEVGTRLLHSQPTPFPDGVFVILLSALRDPALLQPTLANALNLKDQSNKTPAETLKAWLQDKKALLILDNFEQITAAAPQVAALLSAAPQVTILVTSRICLSIYGEHEFAVPPLETPDLDDLPDVTRLSEYAAVNLFLTRSRAVNPNMTLNRENATAIAELCVRLDGLPLALELAAARSKLFSPQAMVARLHDALTFLADGAQHTEARHQTLRATLDWSYQLLGASAKKLFARLAVFARRFSIEAVEAVCAIDNDLDLLDNLTTLLNNSLVRHTEQDGEIRFAMLATIRDYAWAQLPPHEATRIQQQHAAYFLAQAQQAEQALYRSEQSTGLAQLKGEDDNLRAALTWAFNNVENENSLMLGSRLAVALGRFWKITGRVNEARTWLERALAHQSLLPLTLQVQLLSQAGSFAQLQGDYVTAQTHLAAAQTRAHTVGDPCLLAEVLHYLGMTYGRQANYGRAEQCLLESLALQRQTGGSQQPLYAITLNNLATTYSYLEQYDKALPYYQEGLAIKRARHDQLGVAITLANLANCYSYYQQDYHQAATLLRESLQLKAQMQDLVALANGLIQMAGLAERQGQLERSVRFFAAGDAAQRQLNIRAPQKIRAEIEGDLNKLRTALGEPAFTHAWSVGSRMPLEEAVTYALADL